MNAQNAASCLRAVTQAGFRYTPDITEGTMAVWTEVLRDVTVDAGRLAVIEMAKTSADFPTPHDFRAVARRLHQEAEQETRQKALMAAGDSAPHKCKCNDTAMIEVDAERDTWRPCDRCNLPAYERWAKGSYLSSNKPTVRSEESTEMSQERIAMLRASIKTTVKRP